MIYIKNTYALQTMCSAIISEVMDELIDQYRDELRDYIEQDVYNAYDETWGGRTGEFGEDIEQHYPISRQGNQYYRSVDIDVSDELMNYDPETYSHGSPNHGGALRYSDLFNIIENGFSTQGKPPCNFPSTMPSRAFMNDFLKHVHDTLRTRFIERCVAHGLPITVAGSIIVE